MSEGLEAILRPAAVLPSSAAVRIVSALEAHDVAKEGVWNATSSIWQRYDRPWDGTAGSHGGATLLGTVAVVYDQPRRHEITIFKVSITPAGVAQGWTTDALCDDALQYADLSLDTCPRSAMLLPPQMDPFHGEVELPAPAAEAAAAPVTVPAGPAAPAEQSYFEKVDVGELLRLRVQKLAEVRQLGQTG